MSIDTQYVAEPVIYKSKGLWARNIDDQCPPYVYLQYMNVLERAEDSVSSRYGTHIINRDAAGSGTSNYYFSSPVTSLARLNYQSSAWRYAGLQNGTIYRRAGNTQGAYTQLALPNTVSGAPSTLSGNTFGAVINSCFETSLPFIFIYDQSASIKDTGTGNPQLTGIDPPQYTANAQPYSPLLTLIDNFATGNSYTSSGFSVAWSHSAIETISATVIGSVVDFWQFGISGSAITGGTASRTQTGPGSGLASTVFSGFPSIVVNPATVFNISLTLDGNATLTGTVGQLQSAEYQVWWEYSTDSGTTWQQPSPTYNSPLLTSIGSYTGPVSVPYVIAVTGLTNLSHLQIRLNVANAVYASSGTSLAATATVGSISASIPNPGAFGAVCNGILANLPTATLDTYQIVSVQSIDPDANGVYQRLLVTLSGVFGGGVDGGVSLYGTSNSQVDGFYYVAAFTSGSKSFQVTLPSPSPVAVSATGGTAQILSTESPADCILTNEYSTPYPAQFSAWGFYQPVSNLTTSFPVGCWSGSVATNSSASVGVTANFNLSQNNQITDGDLIVLTLQVGSPANIANIRLQFDVNSSGYTSSYYYANIVPAYYQGNIANQVSAYNSTQSQILADTLGLITGQTPSTTTAQLQPSNCSTGSDSWVAVYIPRGNFLPVGSAGQSGLDWTNITGWQLVIDTTATAITGDGSSTVACNGLYLQWGYGPSSFAGVGYDYRYTYYNANTGTESSPAPEAQFNEQFGYLSSLSAPFYLRQAVQVTGYYSFDSQVTHVRVYRRGGTLNSNWVQIDQIPNIAGIGLFYYKDTIADAAIQQAQILVLDNDPPVTSSLSSPIQTTLSTATTGPGSSYYSTYAPQSIIAVNSAAVFVPNQLVEIGNSNNVEVVSVVTGGTGQFTATVRLQHNAGEPVNVYAVPRQACNLCAIAYNQVWLAGDPNNPHYLYYSKKGLPESFGPQNYIPVTTPDDPINAVINWRGTLIVGTLKSWFIIVGGAIPYAQPTGSVHGIIAQNGWCEVEGAIFYRSTDGWREFSGADGVYKTLPVEWIFRGNPMCLPPQADPAQATQDVMAYYNNQIFDSYVSLNSGQRYRLIWDRNYSRFRQDDVPATAMLWEKDINTLLVGKQIGTGQYAVVQDQVGDYDDGGWVAGALVQTPINITIQHPYRDLGKPHNLKQFNMLETDVNTQNQTLNTTLLFEDGSTSIVLATQNTGTSRDKCEMIVTGSGQPTAGGQQAYRASILHTMAVTTAPTLYQDTVHVAILPEERASYDSYAQKMGTDLSKFIKQVYLDYTSTVALNCSVYADGSETPYYTFTLPAQTNRAVIRVRMSNLSAGTTAFTMRTWRLIIVTTSTADPLVGFMLWQNPRVEWKPIGNNSYQVKELAE